MTIRTRLWIHATLFVVLLLAIGFVALQAVRQVDEAVVCQDLATRLIKDIADINSLLHEYLRYGEDRMVAQWALKVRSARRTLDEAEATLRHPGERERLGRLRADYTVLEETFLRLGDNDENRRALERDRASRSRIAASELLQERLVGQLTIRAQTIASEAAQLGNLTARGVRRARRMAQGVIAVTGILFTALSVFLAVSVLRRMAGPLAHLQAGARAVGAGNLRHRIAVGPQQDEFAELATSFNRMVHQLQEKMDELERMNARLQELDRLKSRFISSISHEIRTPLHAILNYALLLARGSFGPVTPEQKDRLQRVSRQAQYLNGLVNNSMDLSRIESGALHLEAASLSPGPVLRDCADAVAVEAERKGLRLRVEVPEDVPPVRADHHGLRQILGNLLTNAVKFTKSGGEVVAAARGTARGRVEFTVRDTGIGIPATDHARIFEEFAHVESTEARPGWGAGLGLAITKRLVEAMGGSIRVESEEGRGSLFLVDLPAAGEGDWGGSGA